MSSDIDSLQNHVISLAGLFQACSLVKEIAHTGNCDPEVLHASLSSIIQTDANSVEEVFGDTCNIQYGLKALTQQFNTAVKPDIEITQYAIGLFYLQKKLHNNQAMTTLIASELSKLNLQLQHFDINHPNITAKLADIYQRTISQLGPKILVKGDERILSNQDNANKIRALLLAGIRAAVLFRQCKGSKFKLLLRRKRYLEITNELLNKL